jgi:hypothetical protein
MTDRAAEQEHDRDGALLRLVNRDAAAGCQPAYHSFDAFAPDAAALAESGMHEHYLSEDDFAALVDALNGVLAQYRGYQKRATFAMLLLSMACVVAAVFSFPAAIAVQFVLVGGYMLLSARFRGRCTDELNALLETEVNPAIVERGVRFVLVAETAGCAAWFECDVAALPDGASVRLHRRRRRQAAAAVRRASLMTAEPGAAAAVVVVDGEPRPPVREPVFSGVVVDGACGPAPLPGAAE